jgi:hypothetical protein
LTLRDALQAAGVLQPDYLSVDASYFFVDEDGSVFIIQEPGWFSGAKRKFVAGPRMGQTELISRDELEAYREQVEARWGKYIPESWFHGPRFIPGTDRQTAPLVDGDGVEIGYIDENGEHRYPRNRIYRGI